MDTVWVGGMTPLHLPESQECANGLLVEQHMSHLERAARLADFSNGTERVF